MGYCNHAQRRREPAQRGRAFIRQHGVCGAAVARTIDVTIAGSAIVTPQVNAKRNERRAAAVACGAHALHDGYTDLIYVLLPVWQMEFGLGYAELGLLRGMFAGTMASFQIPAGRMAERFGTATVLALGTAL